MRNHSADQLLQHGYAETFAAYIREIRTAGSLRFRAMTFHFDLARLAPLLAALPDIRVIWRDYHEVIRSGSVVNDFLSVIGLDPAPLAQAASRRLNIRNSAIGSLSLFCSGRLSRPLHGDVRGHRRAVRQVSPTAPDRRPSPKTGQRSVSGWSRHGPSGAGLLGEDGLGHQGARTLSDSAPRVAGMLKEALLLWWAGRPVASSLHAKPTS